VLSCCQSLAQIAGSVSPEIASLLFVGLRLSAEQGVGFLLLGTASRNRLSRFSFRITPGVPEIAVGVTYPPGAARKQSRRRRSCPGPEKTSPPRHVPRPREEYVVVVHGAATRAGPIPSPDEGKGWKRICRAAHGAGPPRGLHSIFSSLPIGWCRTAQLVGRGRASRVCVWPAPPSGVRQGSSGTTTVC
jgi:hypothetical protein